MFGIVTTYLPKKGYGWITPDGEQVQHFFHASDYFGDVIPTWGLRVQFKLTANPGHRIERAVHVTPVEVSK